MSSFKLHSALWTGRMLYTKQRDPLCVPCAIEYPNRSVLPGAILSKIASKFNIYMKGGGETVGLLDSANASDVHGRTETGGHQGSPEEVGEAKNATPDGRGSK
ncbi:hypothetical protein [Bartonella sp. DGB2]|uniref:hypothetical protein n=1 Tax=Bartonella sp. DGB2 TaxID=3388426 RepID=UPI00398FDDC5